MNTGSKQGEYMAKYIFFFLMILTASCANEGRIPERNEIVALPTFLGKYVISGFSVGDRPESGEFYKLTQIVSSSGSKEQYELMLKDANPAVRVMGLVCLRKENYDSSALNDDTAEILALPFGCGGIHMTIGEFSVRLHEDEIFRACFCESVETAGHLISRKGGTH